LNKQDGKTAVLPPEEEGEQGPLSKLLKQQTETNSLLRQYLEKQEKEEEEAEKEEEKVEKQAETMEQTSQGAPKKIGDKPGPFKTEEPEPSKDYVSKQGKEGKEDEPEKEEAYPYPYPEEAKAVAKAFPYPYDAINSKREEIVAKQLFNANQEIARLNGHIAKMVPPDKVEEMVNSRFQTKMMEEGFVSSTGATPPMGQPTEIAKEDVDVDGGSELQKADEVASSVRHLTWEHIIATRQETDPAYHLFLKRTPGVRMKGGI